MLLCGMINPNKCLHVLRVFRKERYSQTEIDYLFYSIVLPDITYGLYVYGASVAKINVLQQFLDKCYKLRFISTQLNIRSLLQKQDKAIFQKAKRHDNHLLFFLSCNIGYVFLSHEE